MSTRPEQSPKRNIVALCSLALLVIAAPELLGGVYPWGMLAIAAGSLATLALVASNAGGEPLPWSPLLSVLSLALGWTVVQWIPWPCALTRVVAPDSVFELGRAYHLFGLPPPSFCPISRDAVATREEVVKGIALLAAFWSSLALARRGFRPAIHHAVAVSAVLLAGVAIAHTMLDAKRVFGVYAPVEVITPAMLSPVLAVNTFGGMLMMCLPLLMALVLVERDKTRKFALLIANAILVFGIFMSRSRGAIGAAVIAVVGFTLLTLRRWQGGGERRLDWARRLERLGVPITLAFGFGLIAYAWSVETVTEFRQGTFDKLGLIAAAIKFALAHPFIGVGRGAFASTFAGPIAPTRFDYAENFPVQWAADWGLPLALLLTSTLAVTMFKALRRARSLDRIGALVGLGAFGLQNLFDLGFELVGVSVVAMTLLAAAVTDRQPPRDLRARPPRSGSLPGAWLFLGAATLLIALRAQAISGENRLVLQRALSDRLDSHDRPGFQQLLSRAVLLHPSEPSYPLLAASEALANNDPNAGKWINRGLQLRPRSVGPHLQAAQWLWNSGRRSQALLELGIAVGIDRIDSRPLLCPIVTVDPLGLAAALPSGEVRLETLNDIVRCFPAQAPGVRAIDRVLMAEFPGDPRAHLREGERLLDEHRVEAALAQAELAKRGEPAPKTRSNALRARVLAVLGRTDEAIALLRESARSATDPGALLGLEAELQCAQGNRRGMLDALERMRGAAAGHAASMAAILRLQGTLETRLGNFGAAQQAYQQAYGIAGDTESLRAIAQAAERAGDRGRALWAYRELCDGQGADRSACAKRDQLLATSNNFEFPAQAAQPIQR